MSANEHEPEPEQSEADAETFRDKIRSIQFLGRGKTSKAKRLVSNQKAEIDAAGGEFT